MELRVGIERPDPQTGRPEFLTDLAYPPDPARNPIRVTIDQPPAVHVIKPGPETVAAPGETSSTT